MAPTAAELAAAKQARKQTKVGINYFEREQYDAAIVAYNEAITLCPDVEVYWTNRALCHRKRNDLTRMEEDCRRAIQLNNNSVKAHFLLGLAFLQQQEYAEGAKEWEKAVDLERYADPRSDMVEELLLELARAKYLLWKHECIKRTSDLKNLKETCELALAEKHSRDSSQIEGFVDDNAKLNSDLEALGRVFNKAAEDDVPTKVPDYLCCKITLDIFRDPVITPSGVTYERARILEHLRKKKDDPTTRKALHPNQLVPNLAIKEAVQAFLDKHGWAYKMA